MRDLRREQAGIQEQIRSSSPRLGALENPWPHQNYHRPGWLVEIPQMGGTPEGNRLARIDAWPRMIAFLARHL
jgi:hypothetical protein